MNRVSLYQKEKTMAYATLMEFDVDFDTHIKIGRGRR